MDFNFYCFGFCYSFSHFYFKAPNYMLAVILFSFVLPSHAFYFQGTELCVGADPYLLYFCFMYFILFFFFFPVLFFYFFSIHAREVMACYIKKFPGEIHNQGWQGGLIATTRDETFWGV